ncbi:hypothetical protein GE107_16800 [Cohnella sp. CFH 77786]|uniref:cold-shock protein n=1 Tax=Cohnella sp. CFH 77786 TaxID=2662265 RepID=UPI001C60B0EC|nr:cold-shock protein [Cohnella sp. CFH 77786]MBW5447715.1 hypothetical protein [Cohnella sp. CFH 77786]
MAYRGKPVEELPLEETVIWTCGNEDCNVWIRDNFSFATVPVCHRCHSPMISGVKMLPPLMNTNKDMKSIKEGIRIL